MPEVTSPRPVEDPLVLRLERPLVLPGVGHLELAFAEKRPRRVEVFGCPALGHGVRVAGRALLLSRALEFAASPRGQDKRAVDGQALRDVAGDRVAVQQRGISGLRHARQECRVGQRPGDGSP